MSSPSKLTLSDLTEAVAGEAVAIRVVTKLLHAGGATDKVFLPTYVKDKQSVTKYAMETRKVEGREVETVLLDSVESQADRIEESLSARQPSGGEGLLEIQRASARCDQTQ